MKKFVAILVVFALFGTVLFAQEAEGVRLTGWGRAIFEPFKMVKADGADPDFGASVGYSWYEGAAVGVSFSATAEKIGFNLDYRVVEGGSAWNSADNAYMWVKPLDFLTIGAGKFNGPADYGIRGKVGQFANSGISGLLGITSLGDEDNIFRRFKPFNGDHAGGIIALTPIEGLIIGAVFNAEVKGTAGSFDSDAYKKFQIGAGYTIANIGIIRAQFLGGLNDLSVIIDPTIPHSFIDKDKKKIGLDGVLTSGTTNRIQVAFALTAVENLTLDIGGLIPIGYEEEEKNAGVVIADYKYQQPFGVSLGADFKAGDFGIGARIDTLMGGYLENRLNGAKWKHSKGFDIAALVEPSYNLGTVTVAGDIGVEFTAKDEIDVKNDFIADEGGLKLGLAAWLGLGLGNGNMRVGLAAKIPTEYDSGKLPLELSLPISMTYSF